MTGSPAQITVRSGPEALPALTEFCRSLLEPLGRTDLVLTAELVIEEVVLNIVQHGYENGEGPIDLEVGIEDERITLVFGDRTPEFDPLAVEQPEVSLMEGKRGLPLVVRMAESTAWNYTDDGRNVLTVVLAVGDADAA